MPQAVAVSLVQCKVSGVPADSLATWLLEFVPERCWMYTSLGVLLRLVSIELEFFLSMGSCTSVARCAASVDSRRRQALVLLH